MMQRNQWFLSTDPEPSFQFLSTSSIPLCASAFRRRRSIQQKLWELLYFRLSLTLLARQSKINAFIPLWNNRWWKCDEKLSQGERGRPLTMEERAGASSKCHEVQFSYVKVQFSKLSYVKVQFSKVQIHLVFFLSSSERFCSLFSLPTGHTGDSTRLEMRPLPKSEMKRKWEVSRNKIICPQFPIAFPDQNKVLELRNDVPGRARALWAKQGLWEGEHVFCKTTPFCRELSRDVKNGTFCYKKIISCCESKKWHALRSEPTPDFILL